MSAVVITPSIVKTIAKVRLGACTFNVIEPDFSTAGRVLRVAERTTVASTALCTDEQVYSTTACYQLGCVKGAIYFFALSDFYYPIAVGVVVTH